MLATPLASVSAALAQVSSAYLATTLTLGLGLPEVSTTVTSTGGWMVMAAVVHPGTTQLPGAPLVNWAPSMVQEKLYESGSSVTWACPWLSVVSQATSVPSDAVATTLASTCGCPCWSATVTVTPHAGTPAQVPLVQTSPAVHALPSLHVVLFGFDEQVPTEPLRLQAWHWLVHAVLQHTPLTQKPVAHWALLVQLSANDGS